MRAPSSSRGCARSRARSRARARRPTRRSRPGRPAASRRATSPRRSRLCCARVERPRLPALVGQRRVCGAALTAASALRVPGAESHGPLSRPVQRLLYVCVWHLSGDHAGAGGGLGRGSRPLARVLCHARNRACVYVGESVRACVRAGVRACGRAGVRACVRACVRARVRACVRARVRACVRACVCVSIVGADARWHASLPASVCIKRGKDARRTLSARVQTAVGGRSGVVTRASAGGGRSKRVGTSLVWGVGA